MKSRTAAGTVGGLGLAVGCLLGTMTPSAAAQSIPTDAGFLSSGPDAGHLFPSAPSVGSRILYPDGGAAPFVVFGGGTGADYNGDGLIDYADHDFTNGNFWIHLNLNTSPPTWDTNAWGAGGMNGVTAYGEGWEDWTGPFSGTGRADYVDHYLPSGRFWVHQNYGDGGFMPNGTSWASGYTHKTQGSGGDPGWEFFAGDFNGDGYTDIVEHYRPTGQFWVYENFTDGGFGDPFTGTGIIASGVSAVGPRWTMVVGDFSGDGRADYADVRADMYGDTPDAGVWIHEQYDDGGFDSVAAWGPLDAGSEEEVIAGNWEPHTISGGTNAGNLQYLIHDVPTGTLRGVENYFYTTHGGGGWTEDVSTSATASAYTFWETLGTPHQVWASLTNDLPNGIGYENGLVTAGTKNLYLLLWGTVATADSDVVEDFLNNMDGQTYLNIWALYGDLRGDKIDNNYSYWGSYHDTSNFCLLGGKKASVEAALASDISTGNLPLDPTGIYVVVGGTEMTCDGVCDGQCGYHYPMSVENGSGQAVQIQYAFVGDMASCGTNSCRPQTEGPNGAPAGDAMVCWVAHEAGEALTDPGFIGDLDFSVQPWPNGAYSNHYFTDGGVAEVLDNGALNREEGDYCQDMTDISAICPNGTPGTNGYNVTWGSYKFCIQQSWTNESGASCAIAP